jgi:fructosamine-3-kinase
VQDVSRSCKQGDQIGRIFDTWVVVYFGQFLGKLHKKRELFADFFHSMYKIGIFRQNMGWATFWATFLQTHLVTLLASCTYATQRRNVDWEQKHFFAKIPNQRFQLCT